MELAKAYDPKLVEDKWYETWTRLDTFKATPGEGTPYCITIPPPNITGSLHMGHALNHSILDTYTRWHRMRGFNALCLPGTDHASIATQNVVEREIAKEGLTRHDLGREKFLERCWEWREEYGNRIVMQLKKLGCSYDWSRLRFTLDESYVEAIYKVFIEWWERGLIYRGARVVNWCPRCQSAISDIEVASEMRSGKLYHFRYPFVDANESPLPSGERANVNQEAPLSPNVGEGPGVRAHIVIATTRPETLLGDSAVAANPEDPRYQTLFGRLLRLPLTDRQIPLIADEYAKIEFGSGAVKVTPAHDLDDFECGLRHHLPQHVIIAEDGTMSAEAGDYAGMDRFEARKKIVEDMEALGLVEKIEDYTINTPLCDRCKTVLEPLLSEQWFVKQDELARPAIDAVEDGRIQIVPERYKRIYLEWMTKIQPWCISRQLWWGHRIPVWWTHDRKQNVAAHSAEDAAAKLAIPADQLHQDEDVLDTWFSSALWPHATLGWPQETEDLKFWYPTNLLSTAQEILFLWVARMIMTGLDFKGEIPFSDVYVHATVLDAKGERMSKSKGNGIDPLDLIDQFGADATRFSLLQQAGMNQDIRFSEDRVKLAGQFCNKLWNASRFVLLSLAVEGEGENVDVEAHDVGANNYSPLPGGTVVDRWIISRLQRTIATVNEKLATYDMDDAMRAIYSFLWDDFCDWYLEMAKSRLRENDPAVKQTLAHVLDSTLRLLHPMMPYITEEIWQALNSTGMGEDADTELQHRNASLSFAAYPEFDSAQIDEEAETQIDLLMNAVRAFRNLRAEGGLPPGQKLLGAAVSQDRKLGLALTDNNDLICNLARLTDLQMHDSPPSGEGTWVSTPVTGGELFLEIGSTLDIPKERERINKEIAKAEADIAGLSGRLSNPQFVERAPAAVIDKARADMAANEDALAKLKERLAKLG
jgi:valyl-tRNA synthetase